MAGHRIKSSKDIVYGIHSVIEAIKSGKEIQKIFLKTNFRSELFGELYNLIKERKLPFQYVPQEKLDRFTGKNHQGVVALISPVEYVNIDVFLPSVFEKGKTPLILVLDRITDVRNFGAIARTAECAGVDAMVIPAKGSAIINSDAVQTSAGALHSIPVCRVNNLRQAVKDLKDSGLQIIAATEKASDNYYSVDFTLPTAIILGSEDEGISEDLLGLSDNAVRIPLAGTIESLNVSAAAAAILFEAVRKRMV